MKKILILVVIVVLFFENKTYGQENRSVEQEQLNTTERNFKNAITFYPLSLLNVYEPSFQIGYERWFNEKWTLKFMGGIIPKYDVANIIEDIFGEDRYYSGFKLNTEAKYILFTSKSKRHCFYLSTDIFFTQVKMQENTSNYLFGSKFEEFIETDRDIIGGHVRIGKQFLLNRFLLEFYSGIGLGKNYEDYYKKKLEYDNSLNPYYDITEKTSDYYKMDYLFNVIIGFRF